MSMRLNDSPSSGWAIGHQIAQEFAMAGYDVYLNDVTETHLRQALKKRAR